MVFCLNTLQTWTSDYLNHSMVAADYARTPVKPALNGEARYEAEDNTTPLMVRRGAYWSVLGGGFYSFGHGGNWMKPADWKKWLDSPASQHMTILRAFFETLDWWSLVPDREILGKGLAFPATQRIPIIRAIFDALDWWSLVPVAARSSNRTWVVVYFPIRKSVDVKLDAVNAMRSATVTWMNPATGRTQAAGQVSAKGTRSFTPPEGWEDVTLVLRAAPVTRRKAN